MIMQLSGETEALPLTVGKIKDEYEDSKGTPNNSKSSAFFALFEFFSHLIFSICLNFLLLLGSNYYSRFQPEGNSNILADEI